MSRAVLRLYLGMAVLAAGLGSASGVRAESTAFFYGPELPPELVAAYDRVVVEPGHGHDPTARTEAGESGAELVAYLSIGEVSRTSGEHDALQPGWVAGENPAWNSAIVDLASPALRAHLLEARFEPLWQRGYRSFFLDTLDSYMALDPRRHDAQREGLVALIEAMHRRHPEARLIANRGFEVLDRVGALLSGVVAESLFEGFDAARQRYAPVPEADRAWLLDRLREAQGRHGLPVTVIDYVAPGQTRRARATASRIRTLGFEPYVSDGALGGVGIGDVEVVPRRVWVLTLGSDDPAHSGPMQAVAPLLEYLGLVPEAHDLTAPMPTPVPGTLAGALVWLEAGELPADYPARLQKLREAGARLVFFGDPRLASDSPLARELGFAARAEEPSGALKVRGTTAGGPKARPAMAAQLPAVHLTGPSTRPHLEVVSDSGFRQVVAATTPWGGAALSHFLRPAGLHGEQAFGLDPIAFLAAALGSEPRPRADLTTEDGRRLASIVVRAGGLSQPSRLRGRPTHAALLRRLLHRHRAPVALDTVASETNPVTAADLRAARELARLPRVTLESPTPSTTLRLPHQGTLAQLSRLLPAGPGEASPMPLAGDYAYVPEGIDESFPFARLQETLRRTDAPRRLCPAALDFHASSLNSPGGYETLDALLQEIAGPALKVVAPEGMTLRARGFSEAVLVRHLDGGFELRAAGALRTLRLPEGRSVDARSVGLRSVHIVHGRSYVSFEPGARHRLYLHPSPASDASAAPREARR